MIDPQSLARLQEVLRRECQSLLVYVEQAFPWTTVSRTAALAELQKIIAREQRAITVLGRYLVRKGKPLPYIGSFPSSFTTINFISLAYLLPLLVSSQKELIEQLEADITAIENEEGRAQLEKLLKVKQEHLTRLEEMEKALHQPLSA